MGKQAYDWSSVSKFEHLDLSQKAKWKVLTPILHSCSTFIIYCNYPHQTPTITQYLRHRHLPSHLESLCKSWSLKTSELKSPIFSSKALVQSFFPSLAQICVPLPKFAISENARKHPTLIPTPRIWWDPYPLHLGYWEANLFSFAKCCKILDE